MYIAHDGDDGSPRATHCSRRQSRAQQPAASQSGASCKGARETERERERDTLTHGRDDDTGGKTRKEGKRTSRRKRPLARILPITHLAIRHLLFAATIVLISFDVSGYTPKRKKQKKKTRFYSRDTLALAISKGTVDIGIYTCQLIMVTPVFRQSVTYSLCSPSGSSARKPERGVDKS
ncbi:hypothetical protein TSAR_000377 [Trichomalopsis sarcophagae]|uniref:Uncharacterized protein n=1 Tax=Trichomalopsis sarcophagae TaxID=543379 RepID=A0A232F8A6_9HYME|nr:hypothetical protein TSAR_000377 [Trichomalopsis sarcophagae]